MKWPRGADFAPVEDHCSKGIPNASIVNLNQGVSIEGVDGVALCCHLSAKS